MGKSSISIAMATYNGDLYLRDQIESIIAQSMKPDEIIVCDDQSTDNTVSILEEYKKRGILKYFINATPQGATHNFQRAISLCTGNYIALSDQDDVWDTDKLKMCYEKMKSIELSDTLPALVFSDLEVVDEKLNLINHSLWKHLNASPEKETFYTLLFGNVVTGCTTFFNRAMARHLNVIPTQTVMHDYWMALIAYGFGQVGIIQRPLMKYRQHAKNVTYNYERTLFNRTTTLFKDVRTSISSNQFLQAEIIQAKEFQRQFNSLLLATKQNDLAAFITLENSGFLKRKWKSFLSNNFI